MSWTAAMMTRRLDEMVAEMSGIKLDELPVIS